MKEATKTWLAPLAYVVAALVAYGVFWSYSYIKVSNRILQAVTQQRDDLRSALVERCEQQLDRMGYNVTEKEKSEKE